MKKRTKILFGVAILIAIVSMNMRHAWMNYGITENKVLTGVAADSGNVTPTLCDTKFTYQAVVPDRVILTKVIKTNCIVRTEKIYYELSASGREYPVATVITEWSTGETIVKFHGKECSYSNLPCKAEYVREDIPSTQIRCSDQVKRGSCCYPQEAIRDCSILVKMLVTT